MKKYLPFLLAMFALVNQRGSAQVKLGIRFGANMTQTNLDGYVRDLFASETGPGIIIGPTIDFTTPVFGIGFDIATLYDNKHMFLDNEAGKSESISSHNLSIPLNLNWKLHLGPAFRIYVATGPQVSWNIGKSWQEILDKHYELRSSTLSWNVGGGMDFGRNFRLSYTYNTSIGNTGEISSVRQLAEDYLENHKLKNNTHQFHMTYFF